MEQSDLLKKLAATLAKLNVPYAVVGSSASIAYGEPRLTNDIDVVVDLQPHQIESFCAEFPAPEFYLSRPAVESAVRKRFQFNIIHTTSGFKIDCILAGDNEFDRNQLRRAIELEIENGVDVVRFGAPEDIILKKME